MAEATMISGDIKLFNFDHQDPSSPATGPCCVKRRRYMVVGPSIGSTHGIKPIVACVAGQAYAKGGESCINA